MHEPALAASAPTSLLSRLFYWWLAQVNHVLPPTIFFFIGFNLILWTKRLILESTVSNSTAFGLRYWPRYWSEKRSWSRTISPSCAVLTGAPIIQPILF